MKLVLVNYGAGNTKSLTFAFQRLGVSPLVTDDPEEIARADKVVFPGQGEAKTAMSYLKAKGLDKVLVELEQPFLGLCLGMQLMGVYSEERETPCLGILPLSAARFNADIKVPHMGWNTVDFLPHPLFKGVQKDFYMYFANSYYVADNPASIGTTTYQGVRFSAALAQDNYFAIQAHPEKSGDVGHRVLKNFLDF